MPKRTGTCGEARGRAELPSYGCTDSSLPPTDLASAGHGDQGGGGLSCVVVYIEAETISRRSTLYTVSTPALPAQASLLSPSGKESGFFLLRTLTLFGAMVGAADRDLVRLEDRIRNVVYCYHCCSLGVRSLFILQVSSHQIQIRQLVGGAVAELAAPTARQPRTTSIHTCRLASCRFRGNFTES